MSPFEDLHDYIAIPRVSGLRLSPDGSWLAATVQQLGPDGKTFVPAIWRIPVTDGPDGGQAPDPPGGQSLPTRLTWSAQGEDNPAFLPDGSLLFTSARPDLAAWQDSDVTQDGAKPALWLHPAGGGDARRLAAPPGGISGTSAATGAPALVLTCPMLPGADGPDEDAKRRQQRKDAGVTAILHEAPRVRHWDHDLGPDQLRLLMATAANGGLAAPPPDPNPEPGPPPGEPRPDPTPGGPPPGARSAAIGAVASPRRDASRVAAVAVEDGRDVYGVGAIQMELVAGAREHAASVGGREQLAVEAFANALEVIPRTLAENAGMDPIDVLIALRQAHKEGKRSFGVDPFAMKAADMARLGVVEPARAPKQTLASATDAAGMILRIEEVIASKAPEANGKGGGPGGMTPAAEVGWGGGAGRRCW